PAPTAAPRPEPYAAGSAAALVGVFAGERDDGGGGVARQAAAGEADGAVAAAERAVARVLEPQPAAAGGEGAAEDRAEDETNHRAERRRARNRPQQNALDGALVRRVHRRSTCDQTSPACTSSGRRRAARTPRGRARSAA